MDVSFPFDPETYLLIGKVTKAHGLRGELKVYPFSQQPENFKQYKEVFLVHENGKMSPPLAVRKSRQQGNLVIALLDSVSDRTAAEMVVGMGILVLKSAVKPVGQDEFLWFQLIGLPVKTEDGTLCGTVEDIFSNGAQDLLVVHNGDAEYLIPILEDFIVRHDEHEVVIAPPPGLLEINARGDEGKDN